MGAQADREIVQLICGNDPRYVEALGPSVEEAVSLGIFTTAQALSFLAIHVRISRKMASPLIGGTGAASTPSAIATSIGDRRLDDARDFLTDLLLSHVPVEGTLLRLKTLFLALMARRVIQALQGDAMPDDRDYVGNKRLELAGELLGLLFEDLFKRFNGDLKRSIDKVLAKPNRAQEFDVLRLLQLQGDLITSGMIRALSTGNWFLRRFRMERAGVTQVLSRLSYISGLGMMTRITSQFEKTRKVSGPRSLQTSQWGITCPSDTPEGEACGLVKNLALLALISVDSAEGPLRTLILKGLGMVEPIEGFSGAEIHAPGTSVIFLNGIPIGITRFPSQVRGILRKLRRSGFIEPYVSISTSSSSTIQIASDGGRPLRPLLILDDEGTLPLLTMRRLKTISTWDELMAAKGVVEYLDVNEENDSLIAVGPEDIFELKKERKEHHDGGDNDGGEGYQASSIKSTDQKKSISFTHMEIAPWCILGAVAGLIPFPDHNQSPRNTYQSAMGKQAMGTIGYNQFERMDTLLYVLSYPQRPMVKTRTIELTNYERLPAGQNAAVAVMSWSGFDIEDALIINKASLDRGFGRCMVMKKSVVTLKKYANGTYDRIVAPPPSSHSKYEALGGDGIASPGERLLPGHVIINKQIPAGGGIVAGDDLSKNAAAAGGGGEYKTVALTHKAPTSVMVDRVLLTTNGDDQLMVKVLLRSTRRPEIGDKFSSRHGQKGVCGLIVPQADMPFGTDGASAGTIDINGSFNLIFRHFTRYHHESTWISIANDRGQDA